MNFDISGLRRSDRIMGVGAILFFIFLFFFKWYGVSTNAPSIAGANVSGSFSYSGWHTFTNSRWIWLITIIVALAAVAIRAGVLKLETPVAAGMLVAGLGALSTILILYRILDHPSASASFGDVHTSVGIKIGIWLGLIAAAGVTYGGYLRMQDEGTSLSDVREQASDAISGLTPTAAGEGSTEASDRSADTVASSTPPSAAASTVSGETPTPPPATPPGAAS